MKTEKAIKKDITIVTEGEFDAGVLSRLLKDKSFDTKFEILPASGYSSALSKVKSLLSLRDNNIVLLLDTDTVEENEIRQKKDFVNSYINGNMNKDNFKAFWAIPEFEIIFLNNTKFLNALTDKNLDKDMIEVGRNSPKRLLETISKKRREEYLPILDKKEIRDEFFKEGLIKEISDYINK